MKDSNDLAKLFHRYLNNQCTEEEVKQLLEYFNAGDNLTLLNDLVLKQVEQENTFYEPGDELTERIFSNIKKTIAEKNETPDTVIIPSYKRTWFRASAAAVFIILLASATMLFLKTDSTKMVADTIKEKEKNQVVPGK